MKFNSFCKYLEDILSGYPQSDASYLYDKLVDHIRTVQTFALNITTNGTPEDVKTSALEDNMQYDRITQLKDEIATEYIKMVDDIEKDITKTRVF